MRVFGGSGAPRTVESPAPNGRRAGRGSDEKTQDAMTPRRFAPDAVLAYDAFSPAAWLGARTARALRVPLVLVDTGSRRGKGVVSRLCLSAGERLWGRYVRRTASTLVALDAIARARALVGGFPDHRVVVLPPGVDPEEFRPGLASSLI